MNEIGIVICNYNKADYIVNCIQSVLEQSMEADVYVVDNASTDDSVKKIKENFEGQVTLLVNEDNLGGSGGFNTGLRRVLKEKYKYIMLMDNDIVADKDAVKELYHFLETHPEVGMAGSKVYYMDEPEKIWGYGGNIDFKRYVNKDQYKNRVDSAEIPEVSYCDYVAACSLMARTQCIEEVGIMPEENFIYWDDMEWGYRFNEKGYKVAVWGKSKIWHKGGGRTAVNTFSNYYMWRNRLRFFLKVLKERDQREQFADVILDELFRMVYSCHLKGEYNIIKSVMFAFDDAVHGVIGKAAEHKILPRTRDISRVADAIQDAKTVLIKFNGDFEGLGNIIRTIKKSKPQVEIAISANQSDMNEVKNQYKNVEILDKYSPECYDKHMIMCEHIFKLANEMKEDVYIDSWCNIVYTPQDFIYAKSFHSTRDLFKICRKEMLMSQGGQEGDSTGNI